MRVRVRVPATSANLGPGFDALGLALGLHNEVILEEADGVSVSVEGEGAGRLDGDATNVVARGVALAFEAAGRPFRGGRLRCVNRIPLSRGLGSSAAAWVGGLVAANALLGEPLDRDALVAAAAGAEGHPDNVAAALLGGLTVSCADGPRVTAVSLPVPRENAWVALLPETESSTREARAVLPDSGWEQLARSGSEEAAPSA
jgi:homoserine kinase